MVRQSLYSIVPWLLLSIGEKVHIKLQVIAKTQILMNSNCPKTFVVCNILTFLYLIPPFLNFFCSFVFAESSYLEKSTNFFVIGKKQ